MEASDSKSTVLGYGALGLALGTVVLPFLYLILLRARIAQRFDPTWTTIFLVVLLGPAVALSLYGWFRARGSPAE